MGLRRLVCLAVLGWPLWAVAGEKLSVDLTRPDGSRGVRVMSFGAGVYMPAQVGGKKCVGTDIHNTRKIKRRCLYLYFDVDGPMPADRSMGAKLTIEYFDRGRGHFVVLYDSWDAGNAGAFKLGGAVHLKGTNAWRRQVFLLPDASIRGRSHGGDLRLCTRGSDIHVSALSVEKLPRAEIERQIAERERERQETEAGSRARARAALAALGKRAQPRSPFDTLVWMYAEPVLLKTPGPWNAGRPQPRDALESWQRCIDWCAQHGIRRIVAHGILNSGWSGGGPDYANLVDWSKTEFPECALVPRDKVEANIAAANRVLDYAASKGVAVYSHNFNFSVPNALKKKHPDVTSAWKRDRSKPIASSAEWASPTYQRFLETAWRAMFRNLPNLAGRADTIGEMNKGCKDKTRAAVEFAQMALRLHRELGKQPMMRNWWMHRCHAWLHHPIETKLPRGIDWVAKFSHTDAVTREPDREFTDWIRAGQRIIFQVYYPGENAGPFTWVDPEFVWHNARSAKEVGAAGMALWYGYGNTPEWNVARLNAEAFLAYATGALPLERFDRAAWERCVGTLLGTDGKAALEAMQLYSNAFLSLGRVVSSPAEGIHVGGIIHTLPPDRHFITLGYHSGNPPAQWRHGLSGYLELLTWLRKHEHRWRDDADRHVAGDRMPCLAFLRQLASDAARAADILSKLKAEDAGQLELLRVNARAVHHYLTHWERLLWSRAKFEALRFNVQGCPASLADSCVRDFEEALAHLRKAEDLLGGPLALMRRDRAKELPELKTRLAAILALKAKGIFWKKGLDMERGALDGTVGCQDEPRHDGIRLGTQATWGHVPAHTAGFAQFRFHGKPGRYEVTVRYFDDADDSKNSEATIEVLIDGRSARKWRLNASDNQYHEVGFRAELAPGALIRLEMRTGKETREPCRVDKVSFVPTAP